MNLGICRGWRGGGLGWNERRTEGGEFIGVHRGTQHGTGLNFVFGVDLHAKRTRQGRDGENIATQKLTWMGRNEGTRTIEAMGGNGHDGEIVQGNRDDCPRGNIAYGLYLRKYNP